MPLASLAGLQWYGPAAGAMVDASQGGATTAAKGTARAGGTAAGAGASPLLKPTRLRNSPLLTAGAGVVPQALPKARARPGLVVKVNELSQDDVTGALLTAPIEGGLSMAQVMRLVLAYVAGDATGLDGNPAFKSQDGTKNRLAGTISSGTRNVTTIDGD
jgi:hypothetical protein